MTRHPGSDPYTRETRAWLERRFRLVDAEGIYVPNGPAYGYSQLAERLEQYARFLAVLEPLRHLRFDSVLEVGCADGHLAALAGRAFGVPAYGMELAWSGVKRARRLYGLTGAAADIHDLPLADGSVDLVICSEVLEHVSDVVRAAGELRRVARRHLVVSTPVVADQAAKEAEAQSEDPTEPHGHINHFTREDLIALLGEGTRVLRARSRWIAPLYRRLARDVEGARLQREAFVRFVLESAERPAEVESYYRRELLDRYERPGLPARLTGRRTVATLLRLDLRLARLHPGWTHDAVALRTFAAGDRLDRPRCRRAELLRLLLGGFRAEPLRLEP